MKLQDLLSEATTEQIHERIKKYFIGKTFHPVGHIKKFGGVTVINFPLTIVDLHIDLLNPSAYSFEFYYKTQDCKVKFDGDDQTSTMWPNCDIIIHIINVWARNILISYFKQKNFGVFSVPVNE